ncbi:ATP-binding protein [Candidatus Gribaldobacteria bacterium]|nr:ATP-binding protein [Candidatus Gribaldobacteria bacterium]
MLIDRHISSIIKETTQKEPKIIVLYGPRQAGKTTLLNLLFSGYDPGDFVFLNGDDIRTQEIFSSANLDTLKKAVGEKKYLVIDEAQRIHNIGLNLKLLFDSLKIRIIVSGSASFELANKINEPLTGRSATFFLYPIAVNELKPQPPDLSLEPRLEEFLRFGMYPKVLTLTGEKEKENYLYDLVNNYLYRDVLSLEKVRKPKKVVDLLALLALQIGQEVSVAELAANLALSRRVVEKYLDLLEKMFIIVNLRGLSRNLRKEIYKTSKYYFLDLGLRNCLIRNFNPLKTRNDKGVLFENFFIVEKMKTLNNKGDFANFYFWRTYDQKEIDLIVEKGGKLLAYETKWKEVQAKPPKEWLASYPQAEFFLVNSSNFLDFLR